MKEALKLALEALWTTANPKAEEAITAIKQALAAQPAQREPLIAFRHGCKWCGELNGCEHKQPAQPAQEPVGVFCEDDDIGYVRLIPHQQMKLKAWDKLYTTPQQRPWIGLTEEEIDYLYVEHRGDGGPTAICEQFAKAYEAYLKEKNT